MHGLLWLLRQSTLGKSELPESGDARAVQAAADRLAQTGSNSSWSKEKTLAQLRQFAGSQRGLPRSRRARARAAPPRRGAR